jgi:hypothetical protein
MFKKLFVNILTTVFTSTLLSGQNIPIIELISVSPPKIKWKLKEVGWSQEGDELPGFSVPEEMILTKEE